MQNELIIHNKKKCYQWVYATKTKEIVDKIKELNLFLRNMQKESSCNNIKFHIDEILKLEKINFNIVIDIFIKKLNILNKLEDEFYIVFINSENKEKVKKSEGIINSQDYSVNHESKGIFVIF